MLSRVNSIVHIRKPLIVGTLLVTALLIPTQAFAASLEITQTGESGSNPASSIVVKDDAGTIVKEIDYEGGDATIDPVDVEVGKSYTVSATASGYDFVTKGGAITTDATYPVSLVAVKATDVIVQFKVDGVSDYSGINVSLYKGSSTNGTPNATAVTDASGKITLSDIPHGDYTMQITVPSSLSGYGIPSTQAISVPADATEPVNVTIAPEGTAPEGTPSSSENANTGDSDNQNASSTSSSSNRNNVVESSSASSENSETLSQTGDSKMPVPVIMGLLAAGLGAAGFAIYRKREN